MPKTTEAALEIARKAAALLKERGATRVLLFGSLANGDYPPGRSDIDIYYEGLPDTEAMAVAGRLLDIYGETEIDPIASNFCSPSLKANIEAEGILL